MSKINKVAVVGGTHGNEFSGIYLLKKWQSDPLQLARESFSVDTVFANPKAYGENKRYVDHDLNRQFGIDDLANNELTSYEQTRAKAINQQIGPKGKANSDFIIDLHNTTSNMGPSLILLQSDLFNRQLGAYVKAKMPKAVVVFEDHTSVDEHLFLCSIAKQGVIVEIGPQPQSVIRQDVLDWMEAMTKHILDFVHLNNTNEVPDLPASYDAYRYEETLKLPVDEQGERIGMVHQSVQDNDFEPLRSGDPIFTLFDGTEIFWEGDYEAYPHFINEAAYYDNNLAMSLGKKIVVSTN
ncbi:aspartoacylase [Photobacterium angustum]|uniref:Aspartoacylase n=1 Tax=Photobacterium angustum TaxID=661 RepID=A0A855SGZ9_PHOAN|nr:aspartoacylase [Photobacterium angustum]KJF80840.1 aspartoacylase [Photobacterium damselae subsp. damselae]KJG38413.1 aspartoacylase [Photobacterium angustum]KJG44303.1 aspartoacylase [Photobacterium angustum]KJG48101.1 aspartoacylase [Photobacterium angustum]KJG51981.1 aspartoacylase [Photobacterium angustum]